jgi:hypothetical protein
MNGTLLSEFEKCRGEASEYERKVLLHVLSVFEGYRIGLSWL